MRTNLLARYVEHLLARQARDAARPDTPTRSARVTPSDRDKAAAPEASRRRVRS